MRKEFLVIHIYLSIRLTCFPQCLCHLLRDSKMDTKGERIVKYDPARRKLTVTVVINLCDVCGKELPNPNWNPLSKCCSFTCSKNRPIPCAHCGKTFTRAQSSCVNYCSMDCGHKANKNTTVCPLFF